MKNFILFVLFLPAALGLSNSQTQPTFYPASHRALQQFTYERKYSHSHVTCGRDCSQQTNCVSFNFHEKTRVCELNDATRVQFPEGLVTLYGSFYFDGEEDTPMFSLSSNYNCKFLLDSGYTESGEYTIFPHGFENGLKVFCDMENDGGGWIVIQRRQDGTVDFYRDWQTYQAGFGNLSGEFWIGNDNLLKLSDFTGWWKLRVDLTDWENNTAWLEYGEFGVYNDSYKLYIGVYNNQSTLDSNSLENGQGTSFSTKDRENDMNPTVHCAQLYEGGWWYYFCTKACLNGVYFHQSAVDYRRGIHWGTWKGNYYSLKKSTMKIMHENKHDNKLVSPVRHCSYNSETIAP